MTVLYVSQFGLNLSKTCVFVSAGACCWRIAWPSAVAPTLALHTSPTTFSKDSRGRDLLALHRSLITFSDHSLQRSLLSLESGNYRCCCVLVQ